MTPAPKRTAGICEAIKKADRFVPRDGQRGINEGGCIRSNKNHFYDRINDNLFVEEYE